MTPPSQCYFCSALVQAEKIGTHHDGTTEYFLYECPVCRVQYWEPFKNPGSAWCERDERYKGANLFPPLSPTWNHRQTLARLNPLVGKVFDVGCGTGNFLGWAQTRGWETAGLDFDRNAIKTARTVFRLAHVELGTLAEYISRHLQDKEKYDLVTFFDVFEHLDNHRPFLDGVKYLLKPGGFIALSLPNRLGSRWLQPYDLPPRHLTRWDKKSLADFLTRCGFSVTYLKNVPATYFFIVMKLRFRFQKYFSFNLVRTIEQKRAKTSPQTSSQAIKSYRSPIVMAVQLAATVKDLLIFGLPALLIWFYLSVRQKLSISLLVLAEKNR